MMRVGVEAVSRPLQRAAAAAAAAAAYSTASAAGGASKPNAGSRPPRATGDVGRSVVLVDGVRTPFLTSGTSYENLMAYDLSRMAIAGLIDRLNLSPNIVDHVVVGTVLQDPHTSNIAREAALAAGLPASTPSNTVTLACISSNVAACQGANMIATGQVDTVIAGGTEIMSDLPIRVNRTTRKVLLNMKKYKGVSGAMKAFKTFRREGAPGLEMPAVAEFSTNEVMGHSADRLAMAFGVSREAQDEFALRSHTNATEAQRKGMLEDVLPVMVPGKAVIVTKDNGIRVSPKEKLAQLQPVFIKDFGNITAATSSYFTDGASAGLLMAVDKAKEMGFKPKAYLRKSVFVSRDPKDELLLGPAHAIGKLLKATGLSLSDFDVFEIHEAFAGQVLANLAAMDSNSYCQQHMGRTEKIGVPDMAKINAWGGSLSLGHPFGATGMRLLTAAANRLRHEDGRLALVAACAAGGQGVAQIVERCP